MEHFLGKTVALADGELSPSEVPDLVQELARNPSLVRALQTFVSLDRRRIAKVYEPKRDEKVPQWLIDTVMTTPAAQPASPASNLVQFGRRLLGRLKDTYSMPGWSLAATPAALLIAAGAWLMMPTASHGETMLAAQLQRAIETTPNGQSAPLLTFRPVLTFQDKDRTYCRQFEVRSGEERSGAYACRGQDGNWSVALTTPPVSLRDFAPAGAEDLKRVVTERRVGPPVADAKVDTLIGNRWQDQ